MAVSLLSVHSIHRKDISICVLPLYMFYLFWYLHYYSCLICFNDALIDNFFTTPGTVNPLASIAWQPYMHKYHYGSKWIWFRSLGVPSHLPRQCHPLELQSGSWRTRWWGWRSGFGLGFTFLSFPIFQPREQMTYDWWVLVVDSGQQHNGDQMGASYTFCKACVERCKASTEDQPKENIPFGFRSPKSVGSYPVPLPAPLACLLSQQHGARLVVLCQPCAATQQLDIQNVYSVHTGFKSSHTSQSRSI